MTAHTLPVRRTVLGVLAALVTTGVLIGIMLPLRAHIDIAVVALVMVVPVVVAVVIGGFVAGIVAVVIGFLTYDLLFIPPYGTLVVGRAENWTPLAVYVAVMLLVSRVVDRLSTAEARSRQQQADTERLFAMSEYLVADRPPDELARLVVRTVREAFDLRSVVLLLPAEPELPGGREPSRPSTDGTRLEVVAADGEPLDDGELTALRPAKGIATRLRPVDASRNEGQPEVMQTVVLMVGDRTIGFLGIVGRPLPRHRDELLGAFANHMAAALDRANLREQAVRVGILEEVDRQRRTLLGAVSHDMRTPLSTIKASASALLDPRLSLGDDDREDLLHLIEDRSDRLERVIANLLDLGRLQGGVLTPDRETLSAAEVVEGVLEAVGPSGDRIHVVIDRGLPPVDVDRTLVVEAIVNLVENALRYAPSGTPVRLRAQLTEPGSGSVPSVRLSVEDDGPGIAPADRERVFHMFEQGRAAGDPSGIGGSGLGLAIARAFVEANGGTVNILPRSDRGTVVAVDLPIEGADGAPTSARVAER